MSQESLPMYTVSDNQQPLLPQDIEHAQDQDQGQPHATAMMRVKQLFLVFGNPPQYEPLSVSEDDLEKGLLAATSGASVDPNPSETSTAPAPSATDSAPSTASNNPACVFLRADILNGVAYYTRMALYFPLLGAGTAVLASNLGLVFAMVAVLGFVPPTNALTARTAFGACSAGGAVLGGAVGIAGFAALGVRGFLQAKARKAGFVRPPRGFLENRPWLEQDEDDAGLEERTVILAAIAVSVFGFALGLLVVPALRAAAAEAGVGVLVALGVGVWGIMVPVLPGLIGMLFTTLSRCDPESGFEAGMECCVMYHQRT
ncbi:hypothetical protein C8Q77DRAFT_1097759 [Trametes polyzona]|nr:hypothetical protein C8Q77DRAFT_1097759 [Trametes polyzona]